MHHYDKLTIEQANKVDRIANKHGGYDPNGLREDVAALVVAETSYPVNPPTVQGTTITRPA